VRNCPEFTDKISNAVIDFCCFGLKINELEKLYFLPILSEFDDVSITFYEW